MPTSTNPETASETLIQADIDATPAEVVEMGKMPVERGGAEDQTARFAKHLRRLNEIGAALSAERDIDRLLDRILSGSRELTGADAGTLYLVDPADHQGESDALYFCRPQNDSIELPEHIGSFPVSQSSLAGYVALTGETLRFEDVYQLPDDAPYEFNRSFDQQHGYHTKSVLVVPMKNHMGRIIGVLQLINRKRNYEARLRNAADFQTEVIPFDDESIDLATSLASQAAVALENNRLLKSIENLFDTFVEASINAIEDRDPTTSGHSERVTLLTVAMAEAASEATEGPFANVYFSPHQIKELRYAGLLHDFGKIGVREKILVKSHKLEPMHFQAVLGRLSLYRQAKQTEYRQRKIDILLTVAQKTAADEPAGGSSDLLQQVSQLDEELQSTLQEIDELMATLQRTNDPAVTWLPDDEYAQQQAALDRIAQLEYQDALGNMCPILDTEERIALSIRKGSLTPDEYRQIQEHAQLSYEFLNTIAWTPEFANIPNIAHCHHEKLDGTGYPRGVRANDIPLQARMMAVADIYDALTATDRPYKKSMPVERALKILREEVASGHLDGDVVELFIDREIYRRTENWRPGHSTP